MDVDANRDGEREARLRAQGLPGCVGAALACYRELASTNDEAKVLAERGAPDGLAVVAERQTRGRGRMGRSWVAIPGKALCMTVVLRPAWRLDQLAWLGVLGAVAAVEAAEELGVPGLVIKWPNDVLASGRKLAGVLVEPRVGEGGLDFAVLGIGFNVAQLPTDWPSDLALPATSCAMEGVAVESDAVLMALLRAMDRWYAATREKGPDVLVTPWARWTGSPRLPVLD